MGEPGESELFFIGGVLPQGTSKLKCYSICHWFWCQALHFLNL